ncbi:MAG: NAD-dependent epimerase/dehydratase family protein [Lachnospiraceae bacterium]|nr:NAD-dependent epimerase/dehydratase family protein [Lachnospiraceae bacterium]
MDILVLGGSYFLGPKVIKKALDAGHKITVFNRGSRPLNVPGVREIRGDRSLGDDLLKIDGEYDATVDLCAYVSGDIKRVRDVLGERTGRYVFVSTVDVYKRGTGKLLDESAEFETRDFGGEAGAYILGKVALEKEILEIDDRCVLRPSIIYGPGNYAPRENIYFKWISAAGQILEPSPADGTFQTVSVSDVAEALLRACTDGAFKGRSFNVTPNAFITYEKFSEILKKACGTGFEVIRISPEEAIAGQVPFPYPISAAESEMYDGSALEKTGFEYTDAAEGLREAWEFYVHSR